MDRQKGNYITSATSLNHGEPGGRMANPYQNVTSIWEVTLYVMDNNLFVE